MRKGLYNARINLNRKGPVNCRTSENTFAPVAVKNSYLNITNSSHTIDGGSDRCFFDASSKLC